MILDRWKIQSSVLRTTHRTATRNRAACRGWWLPSMNWGRRLDSAAPGWPLTSALARPRAPRSLPAVACSCRWTSWTSPWTMSARTLTVFGHFWTMYAHIAQYWHADHRVRAMCAHITQYCMLITGLGIWDNVCTYHTVLVCWSQGLGILVSVCTHSTVLACWSQGLGILVNVCTHSTVLACWSQGLGILVNVCTHSTVLACWSQGLGNMGNVSTQIGTLITGFWHFGQSVHTNWHVDHKGLAFWTICVHKLACWSQGFGILPDCYLLPWKFSVCTSL